MGFSHIIGAEHMPVSKHPHFIDYLTNFVATFAAWALIASSAAIGVTFGFHLGSQYHAGLACVFALAALGGEILKPFAVLGVVQAVRRVNLTQCAACLVLALVCIIYSLAADLSISSTIRGDLAAQRGAKAEARKTAQESHTRALAELRGLPPARPERLLRVQIEALAATPGAECGADPGSKKYGPISRRVCPRVAELKSELAVAQRRSVLEDRVDVATTKLASASTDEAVKHADPLAASVAVYAGALGWKWDASSISPWLALLIPLFIEIGSSLGLVVAAFVGGPRRQETVSTGGATLTTEEQAKTQEDPGVDSDGQGDGRGTALTVQGPVPLVPKRGRKLSDRLDVAARIMDTVKELGGAPASARRLAEIIGGRKSTVHNAVRELLDNGMLARRGETLVLA